jgi:hypothetical protein
MILATPDIFIPLLSNTKFIVLASKDLSCMAFFIDTSLSVALTFTSILFGSRSCLNSKASIKSAVAFPFIISGFTPSSLVYFSGS